MSFIDAEFQPLATDRTGPVMGLVVGPRLTEREFAERYAGDWSKRPPQVVEFENEAGEIETRAPGRGTDL